MYNYGRDEQANSFRKFESVSPGTTETYHLLQNLRRRIVLWRIGRAETPVNLNDLIRAIAEHESGTNTHKKRESIRSSLYQNHFQKLEDSGALHVNKKLREYRPGPKHREFITIMGFVAEHTDEPPVAHGQFAAQPAEGRDDKEGDPA